ncbi:MAG: CDP-alcohol phosphatidyltransferase family protein [Ignavibacteria bacterium]
MKELALKSRETEELIDIYFYRPLGYGVAKVAKKLGLTPNIVSILAGIIGVIAGHLFYYTSLKINLIGIALFIISDIFDSADGVLARITNNKTTTGRILDGISGNAVFLSIYVHLALRLYNELGSVLYIGLVFLAVVSHSIQFPIADFYRNAYLYIVIDKKKAELDSLSSGAPLNAGASTSIYYKLYSAVLGIQRLFTKSFKSLYDLVNNKYPEEILPALREEYKRLNQPLIKYYNFLTINSRIIILIISLLFREPIIFIVATIVLYNLVLVYVIVVENKYADKLLQLLKSNDMVNA